MRTFALDLFRCHLLGHVESLDCRNRVVVVMTDLCQAVNQRVGPFVRVPKRFDDPPR
jgi:hypothetical protein